MTDASVNINHANTDDVTTTTTPVVSTESGSNTRITEQYSVFIVLYFMASATSGLVAVAILSGYLKGGNGNLTDYRDSYPLPFACGVTIPTVGNSSILHVFTVSVEDTWDCDAPCASDSNMFFVVLEPVLMLIGLTVLPLLGLIEAKEVPRKLSWLQYPALTALLIIFLYRRIGLDAHEMLQKCMPMSVSCPAKIVSQPLAQEQRFLPLWWDWGSQSDQNQCAKLPVSGDSLSPPIDAWMAMSMPCVNASFVAPEYIQSVTESRVNTKVCLTCVGVAVPCLSQTETHSRKHQTILYGELQGVLNTSLRCYQIFGYVHAGVFVLITFILAFCARMWHLQTRGIRGQYARVSTIDDGQ